MKNIMDHKRDSKNYFITLPDKEKEFVQELVACFHYRNGIKHADGSMGTIEITPGEFNDILSYCLKNKFKYKEE